MPKKDNAALMLEAQMLTMGIADSLTILYDYNSLYRDCDDVTAIARSDMALYVIKTAADKLEDIIERINV